MDGVGTPVHSSGTRDPKHSRRQPNGRLRPVNRHPPPSASIRFGAGKQLAREKRVKGKGQSFQQEALRSDTKPDLLSSAPPPVMAEALQPNEQTVTSGRQVIARLSV